MAEAECYFELGKIHLENERLDKAINQLYLAISIFNELIGRRNKTNVLSHAMLGKCHVLKGDNDIGLKMLIENQSHVELVFGIVSIASAEGFKLIGSIYLTQGQTAKAYKKFVSSHEIYSAINPKHKEVNIIRFNKQKTMFLLNDS